MNLTEDGFLTTERKVTLKPYIPRSPKQVEYMTEDELHRYVGDAMAVDCESYSNYFCIIFRHFRTGKIVKFQCWPDKDIYFNERQLSWIMHNYVTLGFNSISFDLCMIWYAYVCQKTEALQELAKALVYGNITRWTAPKEYGFTVYWTKHVDIIEVCPLKGSLKLYGARIHCKRLQDLPFDLNKPLEDWQIPIVDDYCINDLETTQSIAEFMNDRLSLRNAMSKEFKVDLMSKSDAQIAEAVISHEVEKTTGIKPKKADIEPGSVYYYRPPDFLNFKTQALISTLEDVRGARFTVLPSGYISAPVLDRVVPIGQGLYRMGIGGLHSSEHNVSYVATDDMTIRDRDVASYYPRIILNQGLYPEAIGPVFSNVYNEIVERRLKAKREKNATADKGLKVTINGTFGKTSNQYSIMYSPQMFIQIVITGQLSLLLFVEMMELAGIQVISANTDGVVMLVGKDQEQAYTEVYKTWEAATHFETEETQYRSYYARDVNAYFATKLNGETKVKGPYSEVGSTTGTQLDNNPIALICSDAIKKLLGSNVPFEKTIMECKDLTRFVTVRQVKGGAHKDGHYLGKVVRWYYAKGIAGTINTIQANNKVPETEGAKPCMDLPDEFPSDIDYDWYINKTKEILYDIDYLKRPKQISFF